MEDRLYTPMRSALTMIEVIFVIIILGIVSSIGAEIIANVYESYIVQRAQYRANAKTELALQQITNRLRYAIPGTIYAVTGSTYTHITNVASKTADGLQWVGYDADSFETIACSSSTASCRKPGWNGFIDLDASSTTSLSTPGSNLGLADTIIKKLSNNTKDIKNTYLYFPDYSYIAVSNGSGETFTLPSLSGKMIYERYKLAWSSYALLVDSNGNLNLYYNFAPVPKTGYANGSVSTLLRNVVSFRFKGSEGSMRIKICVNENIGDNNVSSCKEKVVF